MQLFFKIVAQVAVFLQLRFKRKVRANFCALQRCTFTTRGLTSFLNVLAFSNRITTNVVAKLWCKFLCFSTAFQKGSACKFLCPATLHFSCKTAHKFFERVYFLQPYYDKLFFKIVVQVSVFFNGVSKWQCVQIFLPCKVALFLQEGSQVFGRACFQQPYYGKRCCEICYLLPKI